MKTRKEIVDRIEELEQIMNRSCVAESNAAELKRDDLLGVLYDTNWNFQLADCDHLF